MLDFLIYFRNNKANVRFAFIFVLCHLQINKITACNVLHYVGYFLSEIYQL
ncbi:hypothetical protein INT82_14950 [Mannheimia haemolytica]|nr:hypothetical protein [Mannheimia haemolytica]